MKSRWKWLNKEVEQFLPPLSRPSIHLALSSWSQDLPWLPGAQGTPGRRPAAAHSVWRSERSTDRCACTCPRPWLGRCRTPRCHTPLWKEGWRSPGKIHESLSVNSTAHTGSPLTLWKCICQCTVELPQVNRYKNKSISQFNYCHHQ